jgi:nifR3 family TIM-barrel protein
MGSFFLSLPKPFLALAPMEDVTDTVFRQMVSSCAKPDVFFTEFTNADGLLSKGQEIVSQRLQYSEGEHPIVAQLWGKHPDSFYKAAQLVVDLGFDGVDINFGCPQRSVVKSGCGAALIDQPSLVKEIIMAVKHGIKDSKKQIPVSVKTRIGYKSISDSWIPFLLEQQLDALTIHGRTAVQMSESPVYWDHIARAVTSRNKLKVKTYIIGNGDVVNAGEAMQKCQQYSLDGIMIGRGIFHDLWAFDRSEEKHNPTTQELVHLLMTHIKLFDTTWGKTKNAIVKKFFRVYIHGFDGASELRDTLAHTESAKEAVSLLEKFST